MTACRAPLRFVARSLLALSLLSVGCSGTRTIRVEIPPRIDLSSQTIGIVEFSSNSSEKLNQFATQEFMGAVQGAQPGVRFLELGSAEKVVKAVGREALDLDTIKAIGKKYQVASVFTGSYDISNVKPKVSMGTDLSSINASAMVKVSMISKQWDTVTGATMWTTTRWGQWPVANVDKQSGQIVSFSLSLPEDRYGQFVSKLVHGVTNDFRPHYEKRKVPKQ